MGGSSLLTELDEVLYTQPVDIDIIVNALTGEMLAEIDTVCTDLPGEFGEG
jgi:hypothetical protein